MNELDHDPFRRLIHQAGGRQLDPEDAQRLNNHLAGCAACQAEAEELANLDAALRRTFHARWDRAPGPNRPSQKSLDLAVGQAYRTARGLTFRRGWQTVSTVVGIVLLVILLTVGALVVSKALPARQPLPGPVLPMLTSTPEIIPSLTLTATPRAVQLTPQLYTVQAGDTLQSIAHRFGLDPNRLLAFNGLSSAAELRIGQILSLAEGSEIEPSLTPVPTGMSAAGLPRLSIVACAQAQSLPDLLALRSYSGKALPGSGQVQSGDFKIGLWLACDPGFSTSADDREKVSELDGLGVYYAWGYSGPDQKGKTLIYTGFEPSFQKAGWIEPTLSSQVTQSGSRGFVFPITSAPDWSQERVPLRYILKVQAPDGRLQGAELRFDLVGSPEGFVVRNLDVAALPAEALTGVNAGIAKEPAYATRPAEALDPLLAEVAGLTRKWSQKMGTGSGWVHLLTENETQSGRMMLDGSPAPTWTQSDDWYLVDENGHYVNAVNRMLDPIGNEIQVIVLRNGIWDNLTYDRQDPDDPTATFRWDSGIVESFSVELRAGGKLAKSLGQSPDGQEQVTFRVRNQDLDQTAVFDPQTGQLLEWTRERLTDGTPGNGVYKIEQRLTNRRQERVSAPPEAILTLLGQTPQPFQPVAPQGTPTSAGIDPAHNP